MPHSDWMSSFQNRTLGSMHLPGSHDAGTAKDHIDLTTGGTNSNAATQSLTIPEQLEVGTRFFDLRLVTRNKNVVAHHTTAGQGAYSKIGVDDVISEAADWWDKHRTEVAIFRISHTSASTNAHEIVQKSARGAIHTGTGNLCDKTLSDIVTNGGGLVFIFDRGKFGSVINQRKGIHAYAKCNGGGGLDDGIGACGCYSGTHKLEQVITNGLKGQYTHNIDHGGTNSHLWQVYWQKTYTNPMSTTGIQSGTLKKFGGGNDKKPHGGTHGATDYLLNLMKGVGDPTKVKYKIQAEKVRKKGLFRKKVVEAPEILYSSLASRNYSLPSIISYDFVNEAVNGKIIDLNRTGLQTIGDDD